MGPGDTSLKYHMSSHRSDGHAEHSQIQESINNTMRPFARSEEFEKMKEKEYTVYMKEDQHDFYYISEESITSARAKSAEGYAKPEDFSLNTYWVNIQANKYLCTDRENLVKMYIEMSVGFDEEANMDGWSRNYDIKMQLKKYLRVEQEELCKEEHQDAC